MFFILSKILDFIVTPFYWVLFSLIIGFWLRVRKSKRGPVFYKLAVVLLIFFTNPIVFNTVARLWEVPAYPAENIKNPYEIGILLGGSVNTFDKKSNRPVYSLSVDRLLQTIALYKKGKIRKILLSGGSGRIFEQDMRESDFVVDVLLQSGIPREHILVENRSRNTYENAIYSVETLKRNNISGSVLLITSATHMRRSVACFSKAGMHVTPYPVDSKGNTQQFTPDKIILPEPYGFVIWDQIVHEWVGMAVYRVAGYI